MVEFNTVKGGDPEAVQVIGFDVPILDGTGMEVFEGKAVPGIPPVEPASPVVSVILDKG